MLNIEKTNNDRITKETIEKESLFKIVLEDFDPMTFFKNPEAADKARELFYASSINDKVIDITKRLEGLTSEYSDDNITSVFRDIIALDPQLYFDIISIAYYVTVKFSDKKYIEHMYNICDILNNEFGSSSGNINKDEKEEITESEQVIETDDDEGIK